MKAGVPEVRNRKERPRVKPVIGAKSYQGSRTGRCGWNTSFLEIVNDREAIEIRLRGRFRKSLVLRRFIDKI